MKTMTMIETIKLLSPVSVFRKLQVSEVFILNDAGRHQQTVTVRNLKFR